MISTNTLMAETETEREREIERWYNDGKNRMEQMKRKECVVHLYSNSHRKSQLVSHSFTQKPFTIGIIVK